MSPWGDSQQLSVYVRGARSTLLPWGREHALWGSTARASPQARVSSVLRADVICSPHRYKVGENIFFLLMLWHLVALIKCLRCQGLVVPFCRWMPQSGGTEVFFFLSFLSQSLWNFYTNGASAVKHWGWPALGHSGICPGCVQQEPGKLFPLTGRICYWLKLLSL